MGSPIDVHLSATRKNATDRTSGHTKTSSVLRDDLVFDLARMWLVERFTNAVSEERTRDRVLAGVSEADFHLHFLSESFLAP